MLQAAEAGVEGAVAVRFFAVEHAAGPLETRVVHQVVADIDRRIVEVGVRHVFAVQRRFVDKRHVVTVTEILEVELSNNNSRRGLFRVRAQLRELHLSTDPRGKSASSVGHQKTVAARYGCCPWARLDRCDVRPAQFAEPVDAVVTILGTSPCCK